MSFMNMLVNMNWDRLYKACYTQIKYAGNTTNLRNLISCFNDEMLTPASTKTDSAQHKTYQTISAWLPDTFILYKKNYI